MEPRQAPASIGSGGCIANECSLCADLCETVRHELQRLARIRTFHSGETVLAETDEIDFVGHVLSGVLRMQRTLRDGRQQIVGLLLPTDMFGRVFTDASHVAIEAATEATVCCYHRPSFERLLARFPELERRMLVRISKEIDAAQDWILLLARQTIPERVATFLLMLCRKSESNALGLPTLILEVPISRRDMAGYLGTTVESISRAIQQMSRRGIIRIIDPRRFEILDIHRIAMLANCDPEEIELLPSERMASRAGADCRPVDRSGFPRHA